MNIALASDHAGFQYKQIVAEYLTGKNIGVHDFGTNSAEACDYPDYIRQAAAAVADGTCHAGIVFGGSGNGEAISANKVSGIRCALCWDRYTAEMAKQHNNANMLAIGERTIDRQTLFNIVDAWLAAEFEGGRHQRRIDKIEPAEKKAFGNRHAEDQSGIGKMPATITTDELRLKLQHLREILSANNRDAILITGEGAMRWLTGLKHQLAEIAPAADSPVNALVQLNDEGNYRITIAAKQYEMPRLKDQIPQLLEALPEVEYQFAETIPPATQAATTLLPAHDNYQEVIAQLIRPLLGGLEGNQYRKLQWLAETTMLKLVETGRELRPGMTGMAIRGNLLATLASTGIDANLVLIGTAGQEKHLHPIASAGYRLEKGQWTKLVVGARYAEQIVSQTLMVKTGAGISEREKDIYHTLCQAAVDYADLFRTGKNEKEIYAQMKERFKRLEKQSGWKGFAEAAELHHPGGSTSPLGNRDHILNPQGDFTFAPWTQFAINPVEPLTDSKVELQGVVMPDGKPPLMLDMAGEAEKLLPFTKFTA
ncbi:MAG: ribose 5-phosphate isomerase B, partial [Lentisphaeria bacterium]